MKTRMETFHFKHNDLTSAATLETLLGKYKIINVYFDTMKKPEIEVRKLHETSARDWCTGKTQRNWVEREVGGGIGMGNTCKSMADSCQCMTKTITIL